MTIFKQKAMIMPMALAGGGSSSADLLNLKESITVYRNDTLTHLPEYAFSGCTNLKVLDLPAMQSMVVEHQNEVFAETQLQAIVFRGGMFYWMDDDLVYNVLQANDVKLYVPRAYCELERADVEEQFGYAWAECLYYLPLEDYTVDGTVTGALDLAKMGIN